jgi:hypothetical protein
MWVWILRCSNGYRAAMSGIDVLDVKTFPQTGKIIRLKHVCPST